VRLAVKSGILIDKAIRVIANANTESLNDITCSIFILGVNAFVAIGNTSDMAKKILL
jgi:hypothetical protein